MIIHESAEMYLETIYMLQKKLQHVRSIDIVKKMGFSKPTVSEQMKKFRKNKYIEMDSNGYITLTPKGNDIAEQMYERHMVIAKILMSLGVDEETAYQDSCRIEHYISEKTYSCIKAHHENKVLNNKKSET